MIHVCFALYDKTGTYSRFTGTAMLSLFENCSIPSPSITVHLLHDNTLTDDNREKFIQIANRYGQILKFYDVEKLCTDRIAEIEEYFPQARDSHYSIAMFYRFFIPYLLFPQGVEKAIYLDSDIIVNLDISEFWRVELRNHPLGVVPEIDNGTPVREVVLLIRDDIIPEEVYFNDGIMLMNLRVLQNEEYKIMAGMKYISKYPNAVCLDQDVLNYCFAASSLRLPMKFNYYVKFARLNGKFNLEDKILHYADGRNSLSMDSNDPYNRLFMDYLIKTPWLDVDTACALSGTWLPSRKNYSVSVVIPMYNAGEYIGECLDSLLIQTFQDFEVIIVDDCSIDDSVKIVEEYAPKFNGKLKLEKTEKNSGGGCVPRNIGIGLARGEYIQFLDADDMLLGNALRNSYTSAVLYDADVVYTAAYYMLKSPNDIYPYKDGMYEKMICALKEFTIDDPDKNLSRLLLESPEGNFHTCWTKFVRRDLLLKNKIFFPNLSIVGDFVWVINLYCLARRFLRISTPLYFHRSYNNNSLTRTIKPPREQCWQCLSAFVNFTKALHELEKENKILAKNPLYCLEASKKNFAWSFNQIEYARKELGNEGIYKILHNEFAKSFPDLSAVLLSFLFSFINEKVANDYYIELFSKFCFYFTAKIFVCINKKMANEAIQILSVSDGKAKLSKPEWWQRNRTSHMIDSSRGEVEIVAKAIVEGQVEIILSAPYVEDPEDRSKHIPYWIDYTALTVNSKTIFEKLTPIWHYRPYSYKMEVTAGDEIRIKTEWLPHRDDRLDISADIVNEKINTTTHKPTTLESKTIKSLSKRDTARIDVKFVSRASYGDFQILSASDNKAEILKPKWFQRNGIGYMIQSYAGKLEFVAKATTDGQITFNLRGKEIRTSEDWKNGIARRIPYWVDYTKLIVNERTILDSRTPAWCDEPYRYSLNVKANEEITVKIEWMPHSNDY